MISGKMVVPEHHRLAKQEERSFDDVPQRALD